MAIDQIVVLFFLLITLIIGIVAGKDIKDIKDYAIANKAYNAPILVLTLVATMIGGGSATGYTAQIFTDGLIFTFANGIGAFIGLMLLGRFIASKFDGRFDNMLSFSDMIKYFYGQNAEILSAVIGYVFCIIAFGIQLIAMGNIMSNCFDIPYINAVVITGGLVVAYSTFGGIRAVTMTDVFQFAVLIVIVPIIANVAAVEAGGLKYLFNKDTMPNHTQIFSHPKFREYVALFFFWCLPFNFMYPSLIQRYLMAKNAKQTSKITYIYGFLNVAMVMMITCIAFAALSLFPDLNPKLIIPTIINNVLPLGIKGLALAGMLAIIMSTADSMLNTGGILLAHNVIPDRLLKTQKSKLNFMKGCTLASGGLGMIIAVQNYNIFNLLLSAETLLIAISVPLVFGIMKFKVNKSCFWYSIITNMTSFIGLQMLNVAEFAIPVICTLVTILSFFTTCYVINEGYIMEEEDKAEGKCSI